MERYSQDVNHGEPWAEPDPQGCWVLHSEAEAAIAAAVAAERERCAQFLDQMAKDYEAMGNSEAAGLCDFLASGIRA